MFIKVGDPQPVLKIYSSKELFKLVSEEKEKEEDERNEKKEEKSFDLEK